MQGPGNTAEFLRLKDCQVVAACDLDKNHLQAAVNTINLLVSMAVYASLDRDTCLGFPLFAVGFFWAPTLTLFGLPIIRRF
jgi:hypothetical protein